MITADRALDAVIALERGDDVPARTLMGDLSTTENPTILMMCWRVLNKRQSTVAALKDALRCEPPIIDVLLGIHVQLLIHDGTW